MTEIMDLDGARKRAMFREMDSDSNIILIGGDPSRRSSPEYKSRYGDRMLDPPLSEFAYSSVSVGAAMAGLRPFVSVHTSSFIFYGWSSLVLEAAYVSYASGGLASAPVVFSLIAGTRRGGGPQHQHTPHAMLQNIPGLRILAPATPAEVDSAIHAALTGKVPTVLVEHSILEVSGEVPDEPLPLSPVSQLNRGSDVAIVTYSYMTQLAVEASAVLAGEGISVGVFSVPVIAPSPVEAILGAIEGYSSVLFVDESIAPGSPASYWMAHVARNARNVDVDLHCSEPVPIPAAPHLADAVVPSSAGIVDSVRALLDR